MANLQRQLAATAAELDAATVENKEHKRKSLSIQTAYEAQISDLKSELTSIHHDREQLRQAREQLLQRTTRMAGQIASLEQMTQDDTEPLDEQTSNIPLNKLRKADLVAVRSQLENTTVELTATQEDLTARKEELSAQGDELLKLKRTHAQATREIKELEGERSELVRKLREQQKESADRSEYAKDLEHKLERTKGVADSSTYELNKLGNKMREATQTIAQLTKDGDKLRSRLGTKEELVRAQASELANLRVRLEEQMTESLRKDRLIDQSREEALEARGKADEKEQAASWLAGEKERLKLQLDRRSAEIVDKVAEVSRLDQEVRNLTRRVEEAGKDPEVGLNMHKMEKLREIAGVYNPVKSMPQVTVLNSLTDAITSQSAEISRISETRLKPMAHVKETVIDPTLPPELPPRNKSPARPPAAAISELISGAEASESSAGGGSADNGGAQTAQ
uniref:Uncharacterized protein n=1 Tax=Haptolina ericina TaxID=156174 RepID=A0A7S3FGA4_9EUKA